MSDAEIKAVLTSARTIALVGASVKPYRDANRIMHFLIKAGYTVYPVNPAYQEVDGIRCFPDVKSCPEPIDIVDVFRNPDNVMPVVEDAIAAHARTIWFQLGVVNDAAIARAQSAGLKTIVDLCILIEHRRLIAWAAK